MGALQFAETVVQMITLKSNDYTATTVTISRMFPLNKTASAASPPSGKKKLLCTLYGPITVGTTAATKITTSWDDTGSYVAGVTVPAALALTVGKTTVNAAPGDSYVSTWGFDFT